MNHFSQTTVSHSHDWPACRRPKCINPISTDLSCFGLCEKHLEEMDCISDCHKRAAADSAFSVYARDINTDYGRHEAHGLIT